MTLLMKLRVLQIILCVVNYHDNQVKYFDFLFCDFDDVIKF